MKKTQYESIFILDAEALEQDKQDELLMCGSQNWEHYFLTNQLDANIETLSNVELLEFESKKELDNYINSNEIIDYSLEHKAPMVLAYV
ncbi:MAG: hypothetical protein L3J08_08405 [Flavobacteriaceae bacterium]|nr:hypothetical protein [Flavobacteriaceae bacterium]